MKITTLCLTAVLSLTLAGLSARADVSASDKSFVMKAAQGGMLEVELGKVAAAQGDSQDVKDFGSKMVEDHGKAGDELKSIVTPKGITLPDSLDAKHQKMLDDMKAKSGKDFDKAYITLMVKAHKMDDKLFSKEASSGDDADIKAFAGKTDANVVKPHLSMAEGMQSKMM